MEITRNKYLVRLYDAKNHLLTLQWKGYCPSNQWRQLQTELLSIFDTYTINKVLSDTSQQAVVGKEDSDWMANYLTPQLVTKGLKCVAIVISSNEFTNMAVQNFIELSEGLITIRYFDNISDAQNWIINV